MKLGRILRESLEGVVPRLVAVQPEQARVIDLASAEYQRLLGTGASAEAARRLASALYPGSMSAAIAAGPTFLTAAAHTIGAIESGSAVLPIGQVQWLAPIDPPVMRDCLAFEQHLRNTLPTLAAAMNVAPRIPDVYYEKRPDYCKRMDYELELGFVIGRPGKDLTPEQAKGHLFGVTIFNDFSARDIQAIEMQGLLGPAKGKDFASALGPWITTVDELDVHNLTMVARVNGEEWSRGSSSTIMWRVEEIIAYISKAEGVVAGELIGSGTVGRGCGVELGKLLKAGDVIELEIEGIGILRNKMGSPAPAGWMPERRTPATQ